jgi:type VI secretion system protein ImpE
VATARELFDAGKLNEAIEALGAELRQNPSDIQRRTFLFELLCFAGNWERADKQLDILAGSDKDKRLGSLLYRAAIAAEKTRHEKLAKPHGAEGPAAPAGIFNGKPFLSIEDPDPRIGARLEVLAGENYMWIPFEQISLIEMQAPKKLRDLLWAPATIHTLGGSGDLGEVLLPVVSPFSSTHADPNVRLGRMTVWENGVPFGQKMLLVTDQDGDQEIPLLELRKLEIMRPQES